MPMRIVLTHASRLTLSRVMHPAMLDHQNEGVSVALAKSYLGNKAAVKLMSQIKGATKVHFGH